MTQLATVRVLLVEDNPGDARLVEILLSEAGSSADFEVALAGRLEEALRRLEAEGFEVILLDLSLPDSSGLETVSRMRAAAPSTPMVVLSGQDDEEVALRAVQRGAQDYLIKGHGDGDVMARTIRYAIERQRSEEELRESEERFRLLVEGVEDYAIFMLDLEGRVVNWNEGAGRIVGYQEGEILGEHFSTFYTREDVERGHPERELELAAAEGRFQEEGLRVRKDGSSFWADVVVTALRDDAGNLRGFSNLIRDISGRKEAEEALRRSLKELADLKFALDESAIVVMTDVKGTITYANDRFLEISRYGRKELLEQDRRLVDPDRQPRELVEDLWKTVGQGLVWRGEVGDRARDGTRFWVEATVVPFLDERGEPYRCVAVCNDVTASKEAEEALRAREEGFRALIQNASDVITVLEEDGTVRYESPAVERVLGYRPGERSGTKTFGYVHPEDIERVEHTFARAAHEPGVQPPVEFRVRHKDGSWRHLEVTHSNLLDDPNVRGVVANARDVTGRREAEEALRGSLKELGDLKFALDESAIVAMTDVSGRITYVNDRFCEISGYERAELLGQERYLVGPDHHPRELVDEVWGTAGRGEVWRGEIRERAKDGSRYWVDTTIVPFLDERGRPYRYVAICYDITGRKEAERALKESEAKYRTLVEQVPVITYIEAVDRGERRTDLLYVSPQIEAMLGYSPEEWMADPELFEKLLHPEDRERVLAEVARTDETGEPFSVEYRQFTREGRVIWVRDEAVLMQDGEGHPLFWQGVMHDVTDQKRAEERLRRTLGSLLALHEAGQILGSTLEREEIGSWLLEIMQRASGLEAAVIDLLGERRGPWRTTGPEDLWRPARSAPEARAARSEVLQAGQRRLFRLRRPGDPEGEDLVGLYLPLLVRERLIGILEAYGPEAVAEAQNVETITSLAGQAASALENARLYGELAERERRMRELVGQVMAAQEEERRRVAYEVHDGLAQTAAAAHQLLQAFARHHATDSAEGRKTLDRVLELVQQTVGEARDVIADLRPTALDDFGLALAIRQQTERFAGGDRRIEYDETLGDERLPTAVETALYRVAQEALMNAHKHASADRVRITLERLDGSVRLRVRDSGQGFRPDEVATGDGPGERVGISSMRERVALLGGSFEIHSAPGTGTEVVAEIPLPEDHGG